MSECVGRRKGLFRKGGRGLHILRTFLLYFGNMGVLYLHGSTEGYNAGGN